MVGGDGTEMFPLNEMNPCDESEEVIIAQNFVTCKLLLSSWDLSGQFL